MLYREKQYVVKWTNQNYRCCYQTWYIINNFDEIVITSIPVADNLLAFAGNFIYLAEIILFSALVRSISCVTLL